MNRWPRQDPTDDGIDHYDMDRPARGCLIGLIFGLAFWLLVAAVWIGYVHV